MSIMTRMIRLWKADMHGVMDQFEDKKLLLNQHLREMEEALEQKEAQLRNLNASRNRSGGEAEKYDSEIAKLEKDLNAAIEKQKDDIARFLIRKLRPLKDHRDELERHVKSLDNEIRALKECLSEQRLAYERVHLQARDFFRKSERENWEYAFSAATGKTVQEPSDEEIELELLRRKEAVKGGTAA
ncbi:MAG: PspA/IM30 family protein [Desulfobacterales bacterium]